MQNREAGMLSPITTWRSIDETFWNPHIRQLLPVNASSVRRVFPDTPEYSEVVNLRFQGMSESRFLDPAKDSPECMELERDSQSIILALYRRGRIRGTMTLNTPTVAFRGPAIMLEKGVQLEHPHFLSPRQLEFTKLVVDQGLRGTRVALELLMASCIIAAALDKRYFWQVGRQVNSDTSWREKLGFNYNVEWDFNDPSLNGMPSKIGYMDFYTAPDNPHIPWFLRRMYRTVLSLNLSEYPLTGDTSCEPVPVS